jgi:hypothetical protein
MAIGQSLCLCRLWLRRARGGGTSETPRPALTTPEPGEAPGYGWDELMTSPARRTMAHSGKASAKEVPHKAGQGQDDMVARRDAPALLRPRRATLCPVTSASPVHVNPPACTVGPALALGMSCRWLCGEPEHVLRGNPLLAGIAVVESCYLMSVLKFAPFWTLCTVASTLAALLAMALLLMRTAWFRSDQVRNVRGRPRVGGL